MSEEPAPVFDDDVPGLPEALLTPLLDVAGEVLRTLDPADVPVTLRALAGFDRRGLARGAARNQLHRALGLDTKFREKTCQRFLERPEVSVVLEGWSAADALRRGNEAADRADLPLFASTLYAARPAGWEYGLGVVCAVFDGGRREKEEDDDAKALHTQLSTLDEARRRAETARAAAEADVERLDKELREERRSRRAREEQAAAEANEATRRATELEGALARAQAAVDVAEARTQREAQRARAAEEEVRQLRAQLTDAEAQLADTSSALQRAAVPGSGLRYADLQALADAAELAQRLAAGLGGVVEQARGAGESRTNVPRDEPPEAKVVDAPPRGGQTRARRVTAPVPPGMVADSVPALDAMLRTRGVVLIVDGYNVSMRAWGASVSPEEQRERLGAALAELHARTRCEITLVFDGADVGAMRPPRRPGVHVLFSAAGEEADVVVVRAATALPSAVPALVVSSDRWVQEHAEAEEATVVSSDTLLALLRAAE